MIIILCFNDKGISSTRGLFKCLFSRKSFLEQTVSCGCSSKAFCCLEVQNDDSQISTSSCLCPSS